MKTFLSIAFVLCFNVLVSSAQTFTGGGGSIITLTDTSRFDLNLNGLSPSTMDFTFGLEAVTISITHTRDADIDCFLSAPDGTLIELTTDNGGTSDNYTNTIFRHDASTPITSGSAPFTGTFRPEGELWRVNNGQNGNGTWQLRVIDDSNNGITGSLVSWKVTFGNVPAKNYIFNQSNLPIVVINTNGQSIPDDPKIICDMGIIYNGPGVRNHLSDPYNNYSGKIAIEIRGSSSQMFPKKSYGLETRGPNTQVDSNVSLLGMPVEHDWILSANYSDKSFCRNVLAYKLANDMGHYAVRTRFVDVVINGTYKGIYILMESIKRDGNRVDIKKLYTTESSYPDVSGGYIVKIDKTTGSGGAGWNSPYPPVNHSNNQKIYFQYEYPKPDSVILSQKAYIQAYVDSFESRLNGPNFMDSTLGYSKYIGNNSFIDFFLTNEISKNVDGYRISSYLYKDKEKTLKAGPVWDYDIAWGNADYCNANTSTGWSYQFPCTGDGFQPPFWWQRMLQDSNYANQMKCRWVDFRSGILSTSYVHSIIDSVAQVLDESKDYNFTTWPILGTYVWPNPSPYPSTYSGEISNLKNWISARLTWLDSNLPGNCSCSFTVAKQDVACVNSCDGQAIALGISPYKKTYLWDSGEVTDTIKNLCPGQYAVNFEDAVGCKRQASVTITQPAVLAASATLSNANCTGNNCNGSATLSVSGGTAPYSYHWSSGQSSASVNTLCAGNYSVDVIDSRGCSSTVTFTIVNPAAPLISLLSHNEVTCPGGNDGTATINASGGVAPYLYSWSPIGGTGSTASGLSAGVYTVLAIDQNGCRSSHDISITGPAAFSSSNTVFPADCFGAATGSASIQVQGGTAPYSYSWLPSGGNLASASHLTGGNYTVNVTDASGCTFSTQLSINQPLALSNSISSVSAHCYGAADGSAQIITSGGLPPYSYQWSPAGGTSASATSLFAGTYSVLVRDANLCGRTEMITVGQAQQIALSTISSPAQCGGFDGSAMVTATGGTSPYQYAWSPVGGSDSLAQNLSAGFYTVLVTDANACSVSTQVLVVNSNGMTSSIDSKTDVSCYGGNDGAAAVIATSGVLPYTYTWFPSGGNASAASGLTAGTYTVMIEDSMGCVNIQEVKILEPDRLSLNFNIRSVSCFGGNDGSVEALVSGGTLPYNYNWLPFGGNAATAINLTAGNYSLLLSDAKACTISQAIVVDQAPPIQVSFSYTDASCDMNNGAASVFVSGGTGPYSVYWNTPGDTTISLSAIKAGMYSVTITDSMACIKTDSIRIGGTHAPDLAVFSHSSVSCNDGNDGSVILSTVSGSAPYSYTWFPPVSSAASAIGLRSGIYSVSVRDASGCMDSISLLVEEPAPLAMLMFKNDVSCAGAGNGEIFAAAGGGTAPYTYQWSPGAQTGDTAKFLSPGTYTVVVTDHHGCTSGASASITEPIALSAAVLATDELCGGACDGTAVAQLSGGTQPYRYQWCDGDTAALAVHLCEGSCTVTITDGNNCQLQKSFTINGPDPLDVSLVHSDASCAGCQDGSALASVSGGTPPYTYLWSPGGQTSSSVSGLAAGIYEVCVNDTEQCVKCESVQILDGLIGIEELTRSTALYVYPNPMSDQTTFLFSLRCRQHISLDVFDVNGRLVQSLLNVELDVGEHVLSMNATPLATGMYYYRFISNERVQTGRLLLER